MKIVHLGVGLIPVPPGDIAASGEEYIYLLTNQLGRLGCEVDVIDIKGGPQQIEKRQQSSAKFHEAWHLHLPYRYNFPFWEPFFNFILVVTIPSVFFATSSSIVLSRLIGRDKINIIHTHTREVAVAVSITNKLIRKPAATVYSLRNAYKLEKVTWLQKLIRLPEILALKWTDNIIALTPAVKDWLVSEFKVEPTKISQIYAGADIDEVEQFLSRKKGECHQSNIILCTGAIVPRKNQFTAVKAIAKVLKTHPEIKMVFAGPIGEVEYLQSIKRFIAENALSSSIEFRGEISKQDLYNLYSDAKLFLFPSTAEIDPVSLKEALAFGLPVVSSTIKPIANVVNEKGCAILTDTYDVEEIGAAINRLLDDDTLRQSMSLKAKELARTFSYENIAAQMLALYEKLVLDKKRLTQ